MTSCAVVIESDGPCGGSVEPGTPLALCEHHVLIAAEWAARETGVTDVLPSPCRACGSRLGVRYPSGWLCAICEWRAGDIPDGGVAPNRVDVVYYLRFDHRIKIGTTANPRQRLGNIRHDELLAFERGNRLTEQRRHAQFAAQRFARTEWFMADDLLLTHVAELRAGVEDPWAQYALWLSQDAALHG